MSSEKSKFEKFYESMLFNQYTTTLENFQVGQMRPSIKTIYKPKPLVCKPIVKNRTKFIHSLTEWKVPNNFPTETFVKPKEIIRTNPHNVQKRYDKPVDLDREKVRATRPREVMVPQVSLDDAKPEQRNILTEEMYTTSTMRMLGGGAMQHNNIVSAFPGTPAPSNPITLRKSTEHYISPEWRMDSVSWDRRQARYYCEEHRMFWSRRTPK